MRLKASRAKPLTGGFTLIEVLIAMTLLSIMVVLLFGSLKICADSWEKGESKIAQVNEVAVVYNFFQRHLSAAKPLRNDFKEENTFSFQGTAQSLQFVGEFPASARRAGLQLFVLELKAQDNGQFIQVALTPFFPAAEGQEFDKEEVVLVNHVKKFTLTYFGSEEGADEGVWQSEWLSKESQPQLVKISIELENGIFWPDMVIELKVTGLNDAAGQDSDTEGTGTIEEGV